MDYLHNHRAALERAVMGELPDQVDERSTVYAQAVFELYDSGYIKAINASSDGAMCLMEPRITIAGREYLDKLNNRMDEASPSGKTRRIGMRLLDGFGGFLGGLALAWASKFL